MSNPKCIHCGSPNIWSDNSMEGCDDCNKLWSTTDNPYGVPNIVKVEDDFYQGCYSPDSIDENCFEDGEGGLICHYGA